MASPAHAGRPRTFVGRLLLWPGLAVLAVLLVLGVVLDRVLESHFVNQLTDSLTDEAVTVRQLLPSDGNLQAEVVGLGGATEARITVIRTDGVVLADSERDPAVIENHRDRPEVQAALSGRVGVASRVSATVGIAFRYVALPPTGDRIVRLALPLTSVQRELTTIRLILVVGFSLAAVTGVAVLAAISRGLARPLQAIAESVERVGRGEERLEVPEQGPEELARLAATVNRMRAEVERRIEALGREQAVREAVLASLEEGVVLFDVSGAASYRSARIHQLLNRPIDQERDLSPPALRELVAQARRERAVRSAEVVAGVPRRSLESTAVPLDEGRVLLVLRDVTGRRLAETIRREFVANASHELKTPVASIRALAETMAGSARSDPESTVRFLTQLEREAVRLSRIVSDLLDLSRLEGERGERSEFRLDRLVEEEVERMQERAREANLRLTCMAGRPTTVVGSRADLTLLVRNLVENAIQYTRAGGEVAVTLSNENGTARLEVRDTGIGIPQRDQGRIFERFYRVDRARSRDTGGTGLGLSIVKHVADNHGGTVTVDSELGRGSTFVVRLPLAPHA